MARFTDVVFLVYFVVHIPIAIFIDFQAILPEHWYPKQLVDVRKWYCAEFRDPMMMAPPAWFSTFILCELFLQLPFFFVAAWAYYQGAQRAQWIRTPVIVYSSHVATTVLAIFNHAFTHDFSDSKYPGPRNLEERVKICGIYAPFLFVPLWILADACFSRVYVDKLVKEKRR